MPGSHTIRATTLGWRSGFNERQHLAADPRTAVCGEQVREPRYDRPDWTRCPECLVAGDVGTPQLTAWTEGEKREAFGR